MELHWPTPTTSSVTKNQPCMFTLIGIALAVSMMTACNQNAGASPPGVSYPAEASSAGDELGVVVDKDMKVLDIEAGSAAAKAGVQAGDMLETVEGVSIGKDKDKAKAIIREPKKDKKLKLKLKRADKDLVIDISPAPPVSHPDAATPTPVFAPQDYF